MARSESRRRDRDAGDFIRRLRVHRGLSPEEFALAVKRHGVKAGYSARRVSVSGDLIRLIERDGHEPGPRIKFAIALFAGLRPGHIWKRDELVELPEEVLDGQAA